MVVLMSPALNSTAVVSCQPSNGSLKNNIWQNCVELDQIVPLGQSSLFIKFTLLVNMQKKIHDNDDIQQTTTVKPAVAATSIERDPPLSSHFRAPPNDFECKRTFIKREPVQRSQRSAKFDPKRWNCVLIRPISMRRCAYMWYLPDHAGGSRIWTLSPALPCGQRNLPHFEFCYNDIFGSDHFYGDRHALLTAVGNWTLLVTVR